MSLNEYVDLISNIGFGTIEIRAKRTYRVLSPNHYNVDNNIVIESVEVCAIKDPVTSDGPFLFTGRTAIYFGNDVLFDDGKGRILLQNQPLAVCDKTSVALAKLERDDIIITDSTYFYDGRGCC